MVTLLIESMNKSPAKRSNFIVVKVVHGGDRSPQYEIFKVAFASFKMNFNKNVDIQIEYGAWSTAVLDNLLDTDVSSGKATLRDLLT